MQKKHLIGYSATGLLALLVGVGAAGSGDATGQSVTSAATTTVTAPPVTSTSPASTVTATATATATRTTTRTKTVTKAPTPKASFPGDGTYQVGTDIKPGTYVSKPPSSGNCYWARLSGSDGLGGIIANNNSAGQSVVAIKAGDTFFETSGCSEWAKR